MKELSRNYEWYYGEPYIGSEAEYEQLFGIFQDRLDNTLPSFGEEICANPTDGLHKCISFILGQQCHQIREKDSDRVITWDEALRLAVGA